MDEAQAELNEDGAWTGRVVHDGVVVAAKLKHCPGLVEKPPPAVAIDVRADDVEYGPEAAKNLACLEKLGDLTRLGLVVTDDLPPPGLTGMEMLIVARVPQFWSPDKLKHLALLKFSSLEGISGLEQLEYLWATQVRHAEVLATLTGLRWLSFDPSEPGELVHVRELGQLEHLDVSGGFLDQADLDAAAQLTALRWLSLRRVHSVEPLRLGALVVHDELRYLDVSEANVDPDSLTQLRQRAARSSFQLVE